MSRRCFVVVLFGGVLGSSLAASAATMPVIQGHIVDVIRGQAVSSLPIELYMDDGDQQFDADDNMAASTFSDESGQYQFGDLNPDAAYFVIAANQVSEIQTPGAIGHVIDTFDITQSIIANPITGARMGSVAGPDEMVLGGHRDMYLEVLGGLADAQLRSNPFSITSNLQIDFAAGVTGMAAVTWDGIAGLRGMEPDAGGLGGMDFTFGGLYEGIMLRLAVDAAGEGQMLRLVLHSEAGSSAAELKFPVVPNVLPTALAYLPFTDFVGNADATEVNAFQLILDSTNPSLDARVSMIGISGPTFVDFGIVPEPSSALLWLAGSWALLLSMRGGRSTSRIGGWSRPR